MFGELVIMVCFFKKLKMNYKGFLFVEDVREIFILEVFKLFYGLIIF